MRLEMMRCRCADAHAKQGYGNTKEDDGGMDGAHPFDLHLRETEELAIMFGVTDPSIRKAIWGHDLPDDQGKRLWGEDILKSETRVINALLRFGYSQWEARLVWAVTDGEGLTRRERKMEVYRKINLLPGAVILKLLDRCANVKHALRAGYHRKLDLYRGEQVDFQRECRTYNDPLAERLWDYLNWLLSQEAEELLFGTLRCCTPVE